MAWQTRPLKDTMRSQKAGETFGDNRYRPQKNGACFGPESATSAGDNAPAKKGSASFQKYSTCFVKGYDFIGKETV